MSTTEGLTVDWDGQNAQSDKITLRVFWLNHAYLAKILCCEGITLYNDKKCI